MTLFADVPLYSSKELLLIQSSPSTKDYGDIFEVIEEMQTYKVVVNICSLVGITFIYKVSVLANVETDWKLQREVRGNIRLAELLYSFELAYEITRIRSR